MDGYPLIGCAARKKIFYYITRVQGVSGWTLSLLLLFVRLTVLKRWLVGEGDVKVNAE